MSLTMCNTKVEPSFLCRLSQFQCMCNCIHIYFLSSEEISTKMLGMTATRRTDHLDSACRTVTSARATVIVFKLDMIGQTPAVGGLCVPLSRYTCM